MFVWIIRMQEIEVSDFLLMDCLKRRSIDRRHLLAAVLSFPIS